MSKRKHAIEAFFQNAVRLQAAGQPAEAERMYREILAAVPGHADSLHMLGVLALQAGQPQLALAQIDQAIAANPRQAAYHLNRAGALHRLGRAEEAIAACHAALRLDRSSAEAQQMLGHVLSGLGRGEAALGAYREAARRKPGLFDIHNNLGVALRDAGRLEEAERSLREAVRREPGEPGIVANLANVLKELGQVTEAEGFFRDALRSRPDDAALRYNLGLLLLLVGNFSEGWRGYEERARAGVVAWPRFHQPVWHGEALAGRTLLVHAEQGFGSIIQFSRYLPLLVQRVGGAGQVVFQAPRALGALLARLKGAPPVVVADQGFSAFDLVCPLLSLPGRFATTIDSVPHAVPYLVAEPDRIARWRERLGPSGVRIGIAWQGNPNSQAELGRSIPLAQFLPLGRLPGVRLISLQKHDGLGQLAGVAGDSVVETLGDEFDAGPDAFVDTAAIMQSLDLIITSDTSIAHLAGALARPVWVALQHVPDWRWMLPQAGGGVEDPHQLGHFSPWYPTMRLFRQERRGDWAGVFAEIAEALSDRLAAGLAVDGAPG